MSGFTKKFESTSQEWATPDDVFMPLQKEFGFTLDAAANWENARAAQFFTADDNALEKDWGKEIVWLNPPYGATTGRLSEWVAKGLSAARGGSTVVMLIPARTNTGWFHDLCLRFGEVRFIRGRPRFIGARYGLPQPLCIVIFRPQ